MEGVIVIDRFNDYESRGWSLTDNGIRKIESLAEKISPLIAEKDAIILCSFSFRSQATARLLQEFLGIDDYEPCPALFTDDLKGLGDMPKIIKLIKSYAKNYDLILVISHGQYYENIADSYAAQLPTGMICDTIELNATNPKAKLLKISYEAEKLPYAQ